MTVDSAKIERLEAGYTALQEDQKCHSLLKKYLTKEVWSCQIFSLK